MAAAKFPPTLALLAIDNPPVDTKLLPLILPATLNILVAGSNVNALDAFATPFELKTICVLAPGACKVADPDTVTPLPVIVV